MLNQCFERKAAETTVSQLDGLADQILGVVDRTQWGFFFKLR